MTEDKKRELAQAKVTLDGKKATICGVKMRYATVSQLPDGKSFEWSWEAVERIVNKGGKFKS